jgi:hypothetical protein
MGNGELITLNHAVKNCGQWSRAYELFNSQKVTEYHLPVFNLQVDAKPGDPLSPETEHSFTLVNGHIAHNALPK